MRKLSYKEAAASLRPGGAEGAALSPESPGAMSIAEAGLTGSSTGLDAGLSQGFEKSTGVSVAHGSRHTGPEAQAACESLNVQAYTLGSDVALSGPSVSPAVEVHEYAHVAQQTGASPEVQGYHGAETTPSGDLEAEADQVSAQVLAGKPATVSVGGQRQVQGKDNDAPVTPPSLGEDASKISAEDLQATYGAEGAQIVKHLKGKTYDEDVTKVLIVLSQWDRATITAVWANVIPDKWLEDFMDNVGTDHFKKFPRECLATCMAESEEGREKRIYKLSHTGFFDSVNEEEARHVYFLMHGLGPDFLAEWKALGKGKHYRAWCKALPRTAIEELKASLDPDKERKRRREEAKRRDQVIADRAALGKLAGGGSGPLNRIKGFLHTHAGDWAVTDEDALAVAEEFEKVGDIAQIAALVRLLEVPDTELHEKCFIDKWVRNLPKDAKYGTYRTTFLKVLQARPLPQALVSLEELLSYGLFDWAVTDAEAKLAYYLIKAQPVSVQKIFRERDNGKWLTRMERNLSRDVVTSTEAVGRVSADGTVKDMGFSTASSEGEAEENRKADEALREDSFGDFQRLLARLEAGPNEAEAQAIYGDLVALPATIRLSMIRRFDAAGHVDTLLTRCGYDFIWNDDRNLITLEILSQRDPMRSVAHIDAMLSRDITNWVIDSKEAYLAFNLLKAMPQRYQDKCRTQNPTWWDTMLAEMSDEQRESDDLNLYGGGKSSADRGDLLGQLLQDGLWEKDNETQLSNVLRMVIAAGQRKQAWVACGQRQAFDTHKALMDTLGFQKDKYTSDGNEANAWYEEGGLQVLHDAGRTVTQGLDFLGQADHIDLVDKVGGVGLELDEAQDVMDSGRIAGMRFKRTGKPGDKGGADDTVNSMDASINPDQGALSVKADHLAIESIKYPAGDVTIATGEGTILGLVVDATYPTRTAPNQRSHFYLGIDEMSFENVLLISRSGITAVSRISVKGAELHMNELPVPKDKLEDEKGRSAALLASVQPAPSFLQRALDTQKNTQKDLQKSVSGGAVRGPGGVTFAVKEIVLEGITTSGGERIDRVEVKDLKIDHELLPSRRVDAQMAAWESMIAAHRATLDGLKGKATLSDLDRHQQDRLKGEIEALESKKRQALARKHDMAGLEKEYLAIYRKQRAGEMLTEEEVARMRALEEEFGPGGVMQLGGVKISGIGSSSGEGDGEITIGHTIGSGSGGSMGLSQLRDPNFAASMVGKSADPERESTVSGSMALDISSISVKDLEVGGAVPDYEAEHKRKQQLGKKEAKGPDALTSQQQTELEKLRVRWKTTMDDGQSYGQVVSTLLEMERAGLAALQSDMALVEKRQKLMKLLRAQPTTIDQLDVRGLKLEVDGSYKETTDETELDEHGRAKKDRVLSGKMKMQVGELYGEGIASGDVSIGSLKATDVSAGADVGAIGKLAGGDLVAEDLREGHLKLGTFEATDIAHAGLGTSVKKVVGSDIDISASTTDTTTRTDAEGVEQTYQGRVSMKVGKLEVTTAKADMKLKQMEASLIKLEKLETDKTITAPQKEQLEALRVDWARYEALLQRSADLEAELGRLRAEMEQKGPSAARRRKIKAVDDAYKDVRAKMVEFEGDAQVETLTIEGLDLEAEGVGNFMDPEFSMGGRSLALNLELKGFKATGLTFRTSEESLAAKSLTITGPVKAGVDATFDESGKELKAGMIRDLAVPEVAADGLKVQFQVEGETIELTVPSAGFKNLQVTDIPLVGFDPLTMKGKIHAEDLNVKFGAQIGDHFTAGGEIGVKSLDFGVLQSDNPDLLGLKLDGLTLKKLGFSDKGTALPGSLVHKLRGKAAVLRLLAGGSADAGYDRKTGAIRFSAAVQTLQTGDARWTSGEHTVVVTGGVGLTGCALDGTAQVDPEVVEAMMANKDPGKTFNPLKEATIKRLKVDRIEAGGIEYTNTKKNLTVKLPVGKKNYLEGLLLTDFKKSTGAFKLQVKKAGVEGVTAEMTSALEKDGEAIGSRLITATANGEVTGITVTKLASGTTEFDITKLVGSKMGAEITDRDSSGKTTAKTTVTNAGGTARGVGGHVDSDGRVHVESGDYKDEKGRTRKGGISNTHGKVVVERGGETTEGTLTGGGADKLTVDHDPDAETTSIGYEGARGTFSGSHDGKETTGKKGGSSEIDLKQFGLELTGADGAVTITKDGFRARTKIDAVNLKKTVLEGTFKKGKGQKLKLDVGTSAVLEPVIVDVEATFYTGDEATARTAKKETLTKSLKVHEVSVPTATVKNTKVTLGDLTIDMPTGHLEGFLCEGLELSGESGKLLPTKPNKMNLPSVDIRGFGVNYGKMLEAKGNQLKIDGMSIDLLVDGEFKIGLPKITALAPHIQLSLASQGGIGGGVVSLQELMLLDAEYDSKTQTAEIDKVRGDVRGGGRVWAVKTGAKKGKKPSMLMRWHLPFLNNLHGHVNVTIPTTGAPIIIPVPVVQDPATWESAFGLVKLPPMATLIPGLELTAAVYNRIVKIVSKGIATATSGGVSALRRQLEKNLGGTDGRKASPAVLWDQNKIGDSVLTEIGRTGRLALDALAGRGLVGSIGEEVLQRGIGMVSDKARAAAERAQWLRRRKVLLDWLKNIDVNSELTCGGPGSGGVRAESKPLAPTAGSPSGWTTWFTADAFGKLSMDGSLQSGIGLGLETELKKLRLDAGKVMVEAERIAVQNDGGVGTSGGAVGGGGRSDIEGDNVRITVK